MLQTQHLYLCESSLRLRWALLGLTLGARTRTRTGTGRLSISPFSNWTFGHCNLRLERRERPAHELY